MVAPVVGFWYLFDYNGNDKWHWVSARYVKNVGKARVLCPKGHTDGKVVAKPAAKLRFLPKPSAKVAGSVTYGTELDIFCKVDGPKVGGNPRWYLVKGGDWVPARWVQTFKGLTPLFLRLG